jgi:hypothetical protein
VALYGQSHSDALTDIECDPDVARYLAQKPAKERLIRIRGKKMKKLPNRYSEQSDRISNGWGYVADICRQAHVFDTEVAGILM